MAMYVQKADLTYVSVPKCACSSLKRFCYEVDNGHAFPEPDRTEEGWKKRVIHRVHPSHFQPALKKRTRQGAFPGDWMAVVRSPVDRLVSCYNSKFGAIVDIPDEDLAERDLEPRPDFATFVAHLADYRELSRMIYRHSAPLSLFLGEDPARYARIFDMSQIDTFCDLINSRAGTQVSLGHFNRAKSGAGRKVVLTDRLVRDIETLFEEDLDLFGTYMKPSACVPA